MEIRKITISNFKGIEGEHTYDTPKVIALNEKNGYGKTSFIDAVRFVLTGWKPSGDIINRKADTASVTIELETGETFTRVESRGKQGSCKMNGKKCSKTALEETLGDRFGTKLSAMKVASCAEVLAGMSSSDLGDLIMGYAPADLTTEGVIGYIDNVTPGMKTIMENNLPVEPFAAEEIEQFYKMAYYTRRELNADLRAKQPLLANMPAVEPKRTKVEVEDEIKKVTAQMKQQAAYKAEKASYDRAVMMKQKKEDSLKELAEQVRQSKMDKPDANKKPALQEEKASAEKAKINAQTTINSMKKDKKAFEDMLKELSSNKCPLSGGIICTTDKTPYKKEFEERVGECDKTIHMQMEIIADADKKLKAVEAGLQECEEIRNKWNQYCLAVNTYLKEKKEWEAMTASMPAEPKQIVFDHDPDTMLKNLNKELGDISKWAEKETLEKEVNALKVEVDDYDRLVKAFDPKGEVKHGMIEYYRTNVEDYCNEEAARLKAGMRLKFVAEDGMKVSCDMGNGSFLEYDSLSGGEKVYMLYILMSLLNNLSGSRVFIMDELSVLDSENFAQLVNLVMADVAEDDGYDLIILASTGKVEDSAVLEANGITPFEL